MSKCPTLRDIATWVIETQVQDHIHIHAHTCTQPHTCLLTYIPTHTHVYIYIYTYVPCSYHIPSLRHAGEETLSYTVQSWRCSFHVLRPCPAPKQKDVTWPCPCSLFSDGGGARLHFGKQTRTIHVVNKQK